MKLIGQFGPTTRTQSIIGWLGLMLFVALLLPWIAIAGGCILAGIIAIQRGERALAICLPAGLALLVLPALLFYLDGRWYQRISDFVLDDDRFTYTLCRNEESVHRQLDDILWVEHRMRRRRTQGYLVKFRDGDGIFISRSLSNSDELARALKDAANNRPRPGE
ncbi:MAG: small multi-drug export protein [Planctomycetaceae bacterium]|nr:small multi-drug export protein [Planctomycetaceae bacterium]